MAHVEFKDRLEIQGHLDPQARKEKLEGLVLQVKKENRVNRVTQVRLENLDHPDQVANP